MVTRKSYNRKHDATGVLRSDFPDFANYLHVAQKRNATEMSQEQRPCDALIVYKVTECIDFCQSMNMAGKDLYVVRLQGNLAFRDRDLARWTESGWLNDNPEIRSMVNKFKQLLEVNDLTTESQNVFFEGIQVFPEVRDGNQHASVFPYRIEFVVFADHGTPFTMPECNEDAFTTN